ncbi:MAG: DUF2784 domain-containing protein [Gammaproteobacteria bacterium]
MSGYSMYEFFADATVLVHALFVLFVVLGQLVILLGWAGGWVWTCNVPFRLIHLVAIGFVVLEAWFGITCPLTTLENNFRDLAGTGRYEMSFIAYWLNHFLFFSFPPWVFTLIYSLFFLLVVATLLAYPPKRSRSS